MQIWQNGRKEEIAVSVSLPSVKDIAKSLKWAFCTLQQRERKQAVAEHFFAHTIKTYPITSYTHAYTRTQTHVYAYVIAWRMFLFRITNSSASESYILVPKPLVVNKLKCFELHICSLTLSRFLAYLLIHAFSRKSLFCSQWEFPFSCKQ